MNVVKIKMFVFRFFSWHGLVSIQNCDEAPRCVLLLACRERIGGFLLHLLLPASRNVADVAQRAHFGLNFKLQLLVFDLNVSTT